MAEITSLAGGPVLAAMAAVVLAAAGAPARADDAAQAAPPAEKKLRDLCTDRPTKSNGPCTVDKGHWQVESDIVNYTVQRAAGLTTETTLATSPVIKYGLIDTSDLELGFTPDEIVRVTDHTTGHSETLSGFGDLYLRTKFWLVGTGGQAFSMGLTPYVKAPTARAGIGNGAWEGGLVVPMNLNLPEGWTLNADPEWDDVHNQSGSGYHWAVQSPLTLNHPLMDKVTGSVELWALYDADPLHPTQQYSGDLAIAWQVNANLQLDGGVNFGLNRETPQTQVYIGVSRRW
jgi:hypothetical protein